MIQQDTFEYCVVIRTLGKAGEMYQQELDSLMQQTIKPKRILVYIAEGYPLPNETVGVEQYIRCPKGMVSQRARDYKEVDTDYCLFLDDDVYLPPYTVEKMYTSLKEMDGDCIAADILPSQNMSLKQKAYSAIVNWVFPFYSKKWGIKIGRTCAFSYNNHPTKDAYLAQNAAGACSLWKIDAFKSIHYTDELWMDQMSFAYGDEMLFYHKLYRNGGKVLIHYKTSIKHLDGKSGRNAYAQDPQRLLNRAKILFILWWRTQFQANDLTLISKFLSLMIYALRCIWEFGLHAAMSIIKLTCNPLSCYLKGLISGYKYVNSDSYKQIPNFIVKKNNQ